MNIKAPSKRVSHLNLKFLNLNFLSIANQSLSTPLPRLGRLSQFHSNEQNSILSLKQSATANMSITENRMQNFASLFSSYAKMNKKSIFVEENTADVTNLGQTTAIDINLNGNTGPDANESVIQYIACDSNKIYQQVSERDRQKKRERSQVKKREIEERSQPKQKCKSLEKFDDYKNSDSVDEQIRRYEKEIKNISKENGMIHEEILKIYYNNLGKQMQVKNIKNMKIINNIKNEGQEKSSILCMQDAQFLKKITKNQLPKSQNPITAQIPSKLKQYKTSRQNKLSQLGLMPKKMHHRSSNPKQKVAFPRLISIGNKYQNFYQDLYKQRKQKLPADIDTLANNDEMDQKNQQYAEAKKKMISNNFDKNFQAYLLQKKIRIPQILKNLR